MIIVTGGSGKVGRAAVKHLMEKGYKVVSIDMAKPPGQSNPPKPGDVSFSRVDICDFGQVMAAFSGIDTRVEEPVTGIVHLGAIASPGEAPDHVIFETNMISTYNVFEAARRLKIRNIVWASSETVYGIPYEKGPAYVPVDEKIEAPSWSYSLSKYMGEKLAEQYCKWDPRLKIVGLRFSNVQEPQDYERFAGEYAKDPMKRRFNLWTYIDARDAAQAIRLSLEADLKGAAYLRHRQRQLGDRQGQQRAAREGVAEGEEDARDQAQRVADLDREGAAGAGVQAAVQLQAPRARGESGEGEGAGEDADRVIPWVQLDTAPVPGGGEFRLMQRGDEFWIMVGTNPLMTSRVGGSEEALATLAAARIGKRPGARMLIGGLGMGFTLRAALGAMGPDADDRRRRAGACGGDLGARAADAGVQGKPRRSARAGRGRGCRQGHRRRDRGTRSCSMSTTDPRGCRGRGTTGSTA